MKVKLANDILEFENEEASIVLLYKGHGMECQKLDLLDEHIEIDCGRTLEYAQKFINSEAQIALFRNSSLHRRCFDIIWNNKTGTNSKLDPPTDLQDFKSSGSGMQHTIVLIMLMINAFASAHMTGKKVYLRNHPESHLHPCIQANLADLLVKFAVTGFPTKQSEFPF